MPTIIAAAAIGRDDDGADWQLRPEEHARMLPAEAGALRRVLERDEFKEIIARFRQADTSAIIAQGRYKRIGRAGLYAATLATLVGALFLMPLEPWLKGQPAVFASAVQVLGLLLAFLASRLLAAVKPFDSWMKSRAEAEMARVELFDVVAKAEEVTRAGEIPLLPLKLEYFRRYQLEVQRRYYSGRGATHAASVWRNNRLLRMSMLITTASVLLAAFAGLNIAAAWDVPVPAPLRSWSASLAGPETHRLLLGLGVVASGLYGLGVARSLMDLDERNASRFLTAAENLGYLTDTRLPQACEAAANGAVDEVLSFIASVQDLIASEHKEWILLSSRERKLDRLRRSATS